MTEKEALTNALKRRAKFGRAGTIPFRTFALDYQQGEDDCHALIVTPAPNAEEIQHIHNTVREAVSKIFQDKTTAEYPPIIWRMALYDEAGKLTGYKLSWKGALQEVEAVQ